MHLDQTAFKTLKNATRPTAFPRPKSVLLFGEMNAGNSIAQVEMLKLTAHLIETGHNVETVSPTSNPLARRIMNFRTPYKFAQSSQFLNRYDHVVVFLETLAAPQYRSTNRWAKTKEYGRMLKFVHQLQAAGRKSFAVGNKLERTIARALPLGLVQQISPNKNAAASIVKDITGESFTPIDLESAEYTVLEHATFRDRDSKFSPHKLLRFLQATQSSDTDLLTLCQLASHPDLRKTSLIKRFRSQPTPNDSHITHSLPPFPVLKMALKLDKSNNLPRYANHLLNTLNRNHKFELNTAQGQKDALDWYKTTAREKLVEFWVPWELPKAPNSAHFENCSKVGQLCRFFNDPKSAPAFDPHFKKILLSRRHKHGPTGMAILLAMLCRIDLPTDKIKSPWNATEIARWFHRSPNVMAPELRQYLSVPTRTPSAKSQAEVIGYPEQQTGLGSNMRMSQQAFDKIGLYHKNRNLNSDFKPQINSNSNTTMPKGNFVLHHVNSERIPMNIMTPQFAYRKDIYHIGYFLWETSKLPDVHKLGIDMVNEIWTPSEFVANLYRQAGAQSVTKVGKALDELPYLKKMASITRPDPNHFTFFTAFDFHSSVERKNPMAVVNAFQRAFPARKNSHVRLVLKSTPSVDGHWGDPNGQMAQIRTAAQIDSRINLIEQMLPLEYLFRLMAQANCVVSAHRGEGFGYLPAYALGLKKPTIVTNWGGVTDFCTSKTAFPVDAQLIDVPQGHAIYDAQGAQWADISVNDLAQNLLDVYENLDMANQRAKLGQAFVQEHYSTDALANTYRKRLITLGLI